MRLRGDYPSWEDFLKFVAAFWLEVFHVPTVPSRDVTDHR